MRDIIYKSQNNILCAGFSQYLLTNKKEHLFDDDLFHEDTEAILLTQAECAEFFLKQIQLGKFNCNFNDSNKIGALFGIYQRIKYNYNDEYGKLKSCFIQTLKHIEDNIETLMNVDFFDVESFYEDLDFYSSVGSYFLLVNAISNIQDRALAGYVLALAKYLKDFPKIESEAGVNYLEVSNIKFRGIKKWFGDISLDYDIYPIANIRKIDNNRWRFKFNQLAPVNNNLLMKAAYESVKDLLAYAFIADVELVSTPTSKWRHYS